MGLASRTNVYDVVACSQGHYKITNKAQKIMRDTTIITDLDGTLLDNEHKLSDYTKAAFKELIGNNLRIGIATGRHYTDAKVIHEKLGLNSFLITCNGAMIHNEKYEPIVVERIDSAIIEDIMLQFDIPDSVHKNLYTEEKWLTDHIRPAFEDYHKDSGFGCDLVDFKELDDYTAIKVYLTSFEPNILNDLEKRITEKYGDQISTTYALSHSLEIMSKGVNKGAALEKALNIFGLNIKKTYAFGDGLNDFEMLSRAGRPYIMENASPQLKEKLPWMTSIGKNSDDAVAKFLQKEFLNVAIS